jgi:hypothetical protein
MTALLASALLSPDEHLTPDIGARIRIGARILSAGSDAEHRWTIRDSGVSLSAATLEASTSWRWSPHVRHQD